MPFSTARRSGSPKTRAPSRARSRPAVRRQDGRHRRRRPPAPARASRLHHLPGQRVGVDQHCAELPQARRQPRTSPRRCRPSTRSSAPHQTKLNRWQMTAESPESRATVYTTLAAGSGVPPRNGGQAVPVHHRAARTGDEDAARALVAGAAPGIPRRPAPLLRVRARPGPGRPAVQRRRRAVRHRGHPHAGGAAEAGDRARRRRPQRRRPPSSCAISAAFSWVPAAWCAPIPNRCPGRWSSRLWCGAAGCGSARCRCRTPWPGGWRTICAPRAMSWPKPVTRRRLLS